MKKEITFKATAINPKTGEVAYYSAVRKEGAAEWDKAFGIRGKWEMCFELTCNSDIARCLRNFRRWATSEIGECAVEMYAIRSGVRDHGRCRVFLYEIAEEC